MRNQRTKRKPTTNHCIELLESRYCLTGFGHFSATQVQCCPIYNPKFLRAADFDGNGTIDLVAAGKNGIVGVTNLGGGTFGAPETLAPANQAPITSMDVADLDGDGNLDIVAGKSGSARLQFLFNQADGSFQARTRYGESTESLVSVGDIDGDGDIDVVESQYRTPADVALVWHENTGNRKFVERPIATQSLPGEEIELADVDGDGDQDILYTAQNEFTWFENTDGLGSFGDKRVFAIGSTADEVEVADFDGDGDLDVVSSTYLNGRLVLHENTGDDDSRFSANPEFFKSNASISTIHAADVNSDGQADILASLGWDGHRVIWFENQRGTFGLAQEISSERIFIPEQVDVADFDGNGTMDVALTVRLTEGRVAWRSNIDGVGTFGPEQSLSVQPLSADALADLDDDGDLDLIGTTSLSLITLKNPGDGRYVEEQFIHDSAPIVVETVDMDNDGDFDLLTADVNNSASVVEIEWFENDGDGNFSSAILIDDSLEWNTPYLSLSGNDIDADGDVDVVASINGRTVLFESSETNGNRSFSSGTILVQTDEEHRDVVVLDINRDGVQDLIASINQAKTDAVAVYIGNEDGSFSLQRTLVNGDNPASFEKVTRQFRAGDIDGDGDVDLVASVVRFTPRVVLSNVEPLEIVWYENLDGVGNFHPGRSLRSIEGGVADFELADFDRDGDQDIFASVGSLRGIMYMYEFDAESMQFTDRVFVAPNVNDSTNNQSVLDFAIGDINSNGTLDIVAGGRNGIVSYSPPLAGDSNGDGIFNSTDLVFVFAAGKYEDNIPNNATFEEGDWNGDGDFDSSDIIFAFQSASYSLAAKIDFAGVAAIDAFFSDLINDGRTKRKAFFVAD